jgi:hypothetical protein
MFITPEVRASERVAIDPSSSNLHVVPGTLEATYR